MTRTPKEEGRRGRQNRTAAQKSRTGTRLSGWAARNLRPGKSRVRGDWVRAMLLGRRVGVGGGGGGGQDGRRSRDCCGEDGWGLQWMWAEVESLFCLFQKIESSNDSYCLLAPQLLLF